MNKTALLASTAVALVLCAASATAQMQQKEEKQSPAQSREVTQGQSGQARDQNAREKSGVENKGAAQSNEGARKGAERTEPKGEQGTAQSAEPKGKQGTAERTTEPKGKQGTAERTSEPKNKQGTAEKNDPKEKTTKGAEKSTPSNEKSANEKSAGAERKGGERRVQLSEQKRNNLHEAFGRERNVNRVSNVNFSISIGTRVPRTVRLAPLPVAIFGIVPEYRNYRYFEANDEICIVEPTTYEIVEVIHVRGSTVAGGAHLVLSESDRTIILRDIDMRSGSTLGLGALSEGADVPHDVQVREFPVTVVDRIPKLKGYRFFTAEGRIAIVDPNHSKVDLVIEGRR